jgi:hypothetical protein
MLIHIKADSYNGSAYGLITQHIIIINTGKTVLFEQQTSLDDSARHDSVFTSWDFITIINLETKVVSLASGSQHTISTNHLQYASTYKIHHMGATLSFMCSPSIHTVLNIQIK